MAAKNQSWGAIKSILNKQTKADIIKLVSELYSLSKSNSDFLSARYVLSPDTIDRYKKEIKKYLGPDEPWKKNTQISLSSAKKVLSDYKKATNDEFSIIDLMIYYVEVGNDFTCEYGDMYEQYYISLESVFDQAIDLTKKHDETMVYHFIERLYFIVRKANGLGWGYYDALHDSFSKSYPEFTA
jgi:hypothetical protein